MITWTSVEALAFKAHFPACTVVFGTKLISSWKFEPLPLTLFAMRSIKLMHLNSNPNYIPVANLSASKLMFHHPGLDESTAQDFHPAPAFRGNAAVSPSSNVDSKVWICFHPVWQIMDSFPTLTKCLVA